MIEGGKIEPTAAAYTACISALGRGGKVDEALSLLSEMGQEGIPAPSAGSYSAAIAACQKAGRRKTSASLVERKRLMLLAKGAVEGGAMGKGTGDLSASGSVVALT